MDYLDVTETIEVPKNTGVRGFLHALEGILKKPRIQSIEIDGRGKISYRFFTRKGEDSPPVALDFETLTPFAAIRNGLAVELDHVSGHAAVALGQLFDRAAVDHLYPVAFVAGANTGFWKWFRKSTGLSLSSHEELFGVPFMTDRLVPDEALVLTAAYARGASLIDLQKSYKIVIPQVTE